MKERKITGTTAMRYIARSENIIERFENETGHLWHENKKDFQRWCNEVLAPTLSPAARRQYRASLALFYETNDLPETLAPDFRLREIHLEQSRATPKRSKRTSANRKKAIPEKAYRAILEELARDRLTVTSQMIAAFLIASSAFGLRPSEWASARLEARRSPRTGLMQYVLIVNNAKHDDVRAHGPVRKIHTNESRIPKAEIEAAEYAIRASQTYIRLYGGDTPEQRDAVVLRMIQQMNIRLASIRKKLGIREKITLYSARHQFIADAKASGLTLYEIAALVGHASIRTASEHYGKKKVGRRGRKIRNDDDGMGTLETLQGSDSEHLSQAAREFRVEPDLRDVANVMARNQGAEIPLSPFLVDVRSGESPRPTQ